MFGSIEQWLMRYVLGIAVCEDAVGCDRVRIEPHAVAGVTSASGWLDTPKGRISVAWQLKDGKMAVHKTLPEGVHEVRD
jgi:alpha-L-rhamnosidase